MQEYAVPARITVTDDDALPDLVDPGADPDRIRLRRRVGAEWRPVTAAEFAAEVRSLAKGLIAAGIQPGQRVGIMSRTRYEWTLVDFALWTAAAVPVPIYETSSVAQTEWILADSAAVACFVESDAHAATVAAARVGAPNLDQVWSLVDDLERLRSSGDAVDDAALDERRGHLNAASPATLIYTSGTTGRPKGCVLTHGNFLFDARAAVEALGPVFSAPSSTLLFLPLAHVFARAIQIGCLASGVVMGHAPDVTNLVDDLASFRPTFLLAVPRVFEKVYNAAVAKAESEGKGKIFSRAVDVAIAHSQAVGRGSVPVGLRLQHALFDRLVYRKLRARLGGQVRWAISGGAPLGARLGHFFDGVGLTILEGYGLTETSAASTVNTPDFLRIGTVGRPLPGTAIRIADDGEVLIRGPHVFGDYWRNEAATAEVFADDWFRSGDLGSLDADGYLTITGRKKEILVTAGGKNVAPAVLEDRLRSHPLVSQCLVVGDARPYIAALVTLDAESLPAWLEARGRRGDLPVHEAASDEEIHAAVSAAVAQANAAVSQAEAIKRFRILTVDFTETEGHLTPSMKLRRTVVMTEFAEDVEELYA